MPVAMVKATVTDFQGFREAHDRYLTRVMERIDTALLMHRLYQSAEDSHVALMVDQWVRVDAAQSMYSDTGFRDAEMNSFLTETPEWHWYIETEAIQLG